MFLKLMRARVRESICSCDIAKLGLSRLGEKLASIPFSVCHCALARPLVGHRSRRKRAGQDYMAKQLNAIML